MHDMQGRDWYSGYAALFAAKLCFADGPVKFIAAMPPPPMLIRNGGAAANQLLT